MIVLTPQRIIEAAALRRYQQRGHPYATKVPVRCTARNADGEQCALPEHKRGAHNLLGWTGLPWMDS